MMSNKPDDCTPGNRFRRLPAVERLALIYKKIYSKFGPQYWWPAKTPFEVMIGAILTQNTSWRNVEKAILNLKKHKLLNPGKLYRLSEEAVSKLIVPAGYHNVKARRLRKFLEFLFENYKGDIKRMFGVETPALRRQLLSVNGIGPETADSILLYALKRPVFVVDAYTKRILSRHMFLKSNATYEETQSLFLEAFTPLPVKPRALARGAGFTGKKENSTDMVKLFNEYHALLVKLAKEFCVKNKPRCDTCPLK